MQLSDLSLLSVGDRVGPATVLLVEPVTGVNVTFGYPDGSTNRLCSLNLIDDYYLEGMTREPERPATGRPHTTA